MERMKQQTVYDCADVNQLWSLIILSGSYSKSISFSVFHVKQWKCLNWWQNTRLIEIQVCQVFDKINLTCSLSTSVIDKRVPYTFCAKHPWAIFFLVDRDLIFSFIYLFIYLFVNRDSSTWLLHFVSMFRTNSALRTNLSKLRCRFPGVLFISRCFEFWK